MPQAQRAAPSQQDADQGQQSLTVEAIRRLTERLNASAPAKAAPANSLGGQVAEDERSLMQVLSLVRHASEAIHHLNEQKQQAEAHAALLSERASQELEALSKRLQAIETRVAEADARASAAEQRAHEAEVRAALSEERLREAEARAEAAEQKAQHAREWLARVHDAVTTAFASQAIEP